MIIRTRRRPALERVIAAADRLFYAKGIHAVGVDQIVSEAKVSKASLYAHFRAKDDLAVDYLRRRSQQVQAHVTAELPRRAETALGQSLAVFELQGELFTRPGYRGCAFINAEAECGAKHPLHEVILEHRLWVRTLFVDLLTRAGATDPNRAARALVLLYDGAQVGAQTEPDVAWAEAARDAAASILEAAIP